MSASIAIIITQNNSKYAAQNGRRHLPFARLIATTDCDLYRLTCPKHRIILYDKPSTIHQQLSNT
eukprot:4303485-Pleurochrysis_carterae.AAC.1